MPEARRAEALQLFLDLEFAKLIDKYHLTAPQGEGQAEEKTDLACTCTSETVTDRARMEELLALWRTKERVDVLALPSLDVVCVECWLSPEESHARHLPADSLDCYNDFLKGCSPRRQKGFPRGEGPVPAPAGGGHRPRRLCLRHGGGRLSPGPRRRQLQIWRSWA